MSIDKRSCVARAQLLLNNPTSENLRYAALDLRLCIEALTYEKLRAFSEVIPESVLETWQPPQAVKALLEFEPTGDRSFTISIGPEEHPGIESKNMLYLGQHTALSLNWLRKHYHKLGSILHAPSLLSAPTIDIGSMASYLNGVVADLTEPLRSTITGGSISQVFSFQCVKCQQPVIGNREAIKKTQKAVCFNPQCGAEYVVSMAKDESAKAQLICTEFDCYECTSLIHIENRKLDIGTVFVCQACGKKHRIASRQWLYGPEEA